MAAGRAIVEFEAPSLKWVDRGLALPRAWHRPWFTGLEKFDPSRPALFVGNHTLYGLLDVPHLLREIYKVHGVFPRSLGDRAHFVVPLWRDLLARLGCVLGSRDNCDALMRAGQHVLVFPGGAREAFKRKDEAYRLVWKDRIGFAHMAARHGYRILPFAAVGAEDAYRIALDAGELIRSPLGTLLRSTGLADKVLRCGEGVAPLALGLGYTALPKPERFYFSFGKPIRTPRLARHADDSEKMHALREKVRASIERQLVQLQTVRDADPQRSLGAALRGAL
jgi:1-acyl-sn-glycerol-3-phosphate acyltransferase